MRTRIRTGVAAAVAVVCATAAVVVGTAGSSVAQPSGLRAFGITADGTIMATFTTDRPQVLDWVRVINGLDVGEFLVGIDIRPQDRTMYGVSNKGAIFSIKTPPEVPDVVISKVSQLQVPLYGTNFGVDFNPAADRLRVISDNGQNLRHNLADHSTVEDTTLTTPPQTGPARGVTAAAYTNNDLNPGTATTLFNINTTLDQVVIQSPANNGTLAATGSTGLDSGPNAGFDIYSDLSNGKTVSVTAFATLTPAAGGSTTLYGVNLFTGATTPMGATPLPFGDLAIALDTN
jgi:hypothetical protein